MVIKVLITFLQHGLECALILGELLALRIVAWWDGGVA
jgi:hypothetical protein